jgi:hypothetical protein|tara:strand:- start:203 stop:403 length:201 start_codon:yes stop_codon:yes gene_type:complete
MPTEPKSSWVKDITFNANILSVKTINGETYNYQGVEGAVYNEMVQAKSKGKFHNQNLRGKYTCVKG